MDPQLLHDYCSKARIVVAAAVNFLRKERSSFRQDAVEYKAYNDLVSYVDKGSEQLLVDGLSRIIPACGFITEENTLSQHSDEWQWIIDPLDGTTNFVHGLPCYAVSVGLTFKGGLVAGIVHEVNLDECFYGWKGGGVWMNENRICVSQQPDLGKALLATGFPYTNYSRMKPYMEVFDYCMRNTQGLRRLGSAAVDLAYVACGRLEAFYEYGLKPWDVAAGAFLVMEAGGRVGDFEGGNDFLFGEEIIAANEGVYEAFLNVVKQNFNENR